MGCNRPRLRSWAAQMAGVIVCGGALPAAAQTSCSATNQYVYDFTNQAAQALSYASTLNYSATNGAAQSQPFTIGFQAFNLNSSAINGNQMPAITNLINDGSPATGRNLMIGGNIRCSLRKHYRQ